YFAHTTLNGAPIFIARTGYTGERGFEISFDNKYAEKIWNALTKAGASPAGLGARDSLRLEATYSLYGHEISDSITPIEAGLFWLVKPKEGIDYIGKETLLKQKSEGTDRIIVGLNLLDRGIIREHYKIFKNGEELTDSGFSVNMVLFSTISPDNGIKISPTALTDSISPAILSFSIVLPISGNST
ncbi:unnamed protein product, partial [marine sediment metagenome]